VWRFGIPTNSTHTCCVSIRPDTVKWIGGGNEILQRIRSKREREITNLVDMRVLEAGALNLVRVRVLSQPRHQNTKFTQTGKAQDAGQCERGCMEVAP
jgi:hypothetical protein